MRTTVARDAVEMDAKLATGHFDLLVLDVMMPGEDGLSVCRRLAPEGDLPIIMLTALGEETDRIVGLEIGADDYLAKPFNPRELPARLKSVLRRSNRDEHVAGSLAGRKVSFAHWILDTDRQVLIDESTTETPLNRHTDGPGQYLPLHRACRGQCVELRRIRDRLCVALGPGRGARGWRRFVRRRR